MPIVIPPIAAGVTAAWSVHLYVYLFYFFLGPELSSLLSQKATLVVVVVVVVVVIPKAFLIRSGVQQNFAYTFTLTFPTDLPSHIFTLISN